MGRRGTAGRRAATVIAAIGLALATVAGTAVYASADSLSDQRKQKEREAAQQAAERESLDAALEGASATLQQTQIDLLAIQQQIPAARQALDDAQATLSAAIRDQEAIATQLADAEAQEAQLTEQITTTADAITTTRRTMDEYAGQVYMGATGPSTLEVMLDASSIEQYADDAAMTELALEIQQRSLGQLTTQESDQRNAEVRQSAVREQISQLKAKADAAVAAADTARQAAADRKSELDNLEAQQKVKAAQAEQDKAQILLEIAAADAEAAQVQRELDDIIAQQVAAEEARRKAAGTGSMTKTPLAGVLFTNPTSINPMYVTSSYGMRMHPILHYVRLHAGIDLRTYCSTPIYAGRAGTVVWAKSRAGFGNQVMVDHGFVNGNSLMSSYNHMSKFSVSAGQSVSQGQLLGYSGNTGTSAACHLHFEVYVNGATTDPAPLLGVG